MVSLPPTPGASNTTTTSTTGTVTGANPVPPVQQVTYNGHRVTNLPTGSVPARQLQGFQPNMQDWQRWANQQPSAL